VALNDPLLAVLEISRFEGREPGASAAGTMEDSTDPVDTRLWP
jgi:hypothetical protein